MTDQILTSLSIITAFHNKNHSIMEAFLPLTEYGIALLCNESEAGHFDTESLKERILQSSGIQINTLTLKSLLKKLKREGLVELLDQGNYFRVITSFQKSQDKYLEALTANHRKVHKFVKEYQDFSHDIREERELTVWIYDFICEYRKFIDVSNNCIVAQFVSDKYQNFLSFLSYINEYESELTETFHSIYFGANIYSLINNSPSTIAKKELQNLVVYLDSNFILRLMDLQEAISTNETTELFNTLKDNQIKLIIFSETVEEIKNVLSFYLAIYKKNYESYTAIVTTENISGVLGAFFRRKLSFVQIENLIDNVDEFVAEHGISIDYLSRYKFMPAQEDVKNLFAIKYDPHNDDKSRSYRTKKCEHYIQIIEVIKYLRSRSRQPSSCLGNSKYIFLTCDLKLNKYCRSITPNYKFPCIISQEMLANDLLLFAPAIFNKISFMLLIALYRTSNYIDVHTLDRLKDTIEAVARDNPTEASFIIEATRNCEDYNELNNLLHDDGDDKLQLLALAEERKRLSSEKESTIQAQQAKIDEDKIAAAEATKKIKALEHKLKEAAERERGLQQQQKEKQKWLFSNDMLSYAKRVKVVSVCCYIAFAVVSSIIAIATGLNYWFIMPLKDSWWAYSLSIIFIVGSIIGAFYNGFDNKWLQQRIYKKETFLAEKYGIDKCDIDDVRNLYLH